MFRLQPLDRLRLARGVEHLVDLGARPVAEAFAEIAHRTGQPEIVLGVVASFSAIDANMVRRVGGRDMPRRQLDAVPSQAER